MGPNGRGRGPWFLAVVGSNPPTHLLGSLWVHFGVILGSVWDHFGVTLGSLWDHFGVNLGSVWGDFGITLGSVWGQFGVTLESLWGHFGITLGSVWGHVSDGWAQTNSSRSKASGPQLISRPHMLSLWLWPTPPARPQCWEG